MSHYPPGEEPTSEALRRAAAAAIGALQGASVPHLLMGGAVTQAFARPRHTDDVDVFVEPSQARRALDALARAGFTIEETDPAWLFKAWRGGVLVDVIFRSSGGIQLDAEMLARGCTRELCGVRALLMSPEDLLVIKAMAATEDVPHHWYDALALVARGDLDWDYVIRRAHVGPSRVLSLVLYAESLGLAVPPRVADALFARVHRPRRATG
ncbi:MAG TPA: nucleotidyltransferase [Acidimicrobiales bacterium]